MIRIYILHFTFALLFFSCNSHAIDIKSANSASLAIEAKECIKKSLQLPPYFARTELEKAIIYFELARARKPAGRDFKANFYGTFGYALAKLAFVNKTLPRCDIKLIKGYLLRANSMYLKAIGMMKRVEIDAITYQNFADINLNLFMIDFQSPGYLQRATYYYDLAIEALTKRLPNLKFIRKKKLPEAEGYLSGMKGNLFLNKAKAYVYMCHKTEDNNTKVACAAKAHESYVAAFSGYTASEIEKQVLIHATEMIYVLHEIGRQNWAAHHGYLYVLPLLENSLFTRFSYKFLSHMAEILLAAWKIEKQPVLLQNSWNCIETAIRKATNFMHEIKGDPKNIMITLWENAGLISLHIYSDCAEDLEKLSYLKKAYEYTANCAQFFPHNYALKDSLRRINVMLDLYNVTLPPEPICGLTRSAISQE